MSFYQIIRLAEVESTNSYLLNHVNRDSRSGLVVQAMRQTAGRGRHGRTWEGFSGNLFFSVFVKPKCSFLDYPQFTHIASLAVTMTLEGLLPDSSKPGIKWPNDVLVTGKKISGILLEVASDAEGPYGIVIGIGINLAKAPDLLSYQATCLAEHPYKNLPLLRVFTNVLRHFHHLYYGWEANGFEDIRKQWLARTIHGQDKSISFSSGSDVISGTFEGLASNGALLIKDVHGITKQYVAGEIMA